MRYVRSFDEPDEVIELETIRSELVSQRGTTIARDVHHPGWRWSTHIRPLVGTEWCEVHHQGLVLGGRLHVVLRDGTEFEAVSMNVIDIPPGHDAWVVGDEPVVTVGWAGAKHWLAPLVFGDRVLASIVFTDIVDSTGTARRLGDRGWSDVLANHESRTRDVLSRFRGREVKMTGDGVLATFDGAARAVRCAVALRDDATHVGLAVRVAVHTGEITVSSDDISGVAVHEASRLLGLASPGQVLLSAATVGLAGDAAADLDDLGDHALRGIDNPMRVYRIRD